MSPALSRLRRIFLPFAIVIGLAASLHSAPAHAQYLRNQGMHFGVGWKALGTTWDAVLGDRYWNATDQADIVVGYYYAIGYQVFFDFQATVGFGSAKVFVGDSVPPVLSFSVSPGLRYNFLEQRVRPFVAAYIDLPLSLVEFSGTDVIPRNAALPGAPGLWVGARAGGGIEWIALDEIGFQIDATMVGYFSVGNVPPAGGKSFPVLPSHTIRVCSNFYF
jgi:hypothetical protein